MLCVAGCVAPSSGTLLKEYTSPVKDAPTVLILGKTAGRMDEVVRLVRDIGGVNVVGTFTEEEAMKRLANTPNIRVVALGGAVSTETRARIRAYMLQHLPGVPTSEPGLRYPYSDANIREDIKRKLARP